MRESAVLAALERVADDLLVRLEELGDGLRPDEVLVELEPLLARYAAAWVLWQVVAQAEHPDDEGDAGRDRTAEVLRQRALDREWEALTRQLRDQPTTD
jgi:hypothetical protein